MAKPFKKFGEPPRKRIKLPGLDVSEPPEYFRSDGTVCPDLLKLADPVGFPPESLDPDAEIDQIVLGLALACNDFRDCQWVLDQTNKGRPKTARLNGYDGARMGLELWATRVLIGIIHELLEALDANHEILTNHAEVPAVLKTMAPAARTAWVWLLSLARASKKADGDRKFLLDVRNNLSYHYDQPVRLSQGYRTLFVESPKEDRNRLAYISQGETLKGTRFFFIDAAAQTAADIANQAPSSFEKELRLRELASRVVDAVFPFVIAFLHLRVYRQLEKQASE